jgi:hypothetical protein
MYIVSLLIFEQHMTQWQEDEEEDVGKLLDDLKERRGYSHMKEEALDRTIWRARFGRDSGPVVRQTAKWMNEYDTVWRKEI